MRALFLVIALTGCAASYEVPFEIQTCEVTGCWPDDMKETRK